MSCDWFTGVGKPVTLDEVYLEIDNYVSAGGKVFVGSDSQLGSETCIFATAICLHGAGAGGKYFFKRFNSTRSPYDVLKVRIMKEVQYSIEIALDILERNPTADIEVHIDVGTSEKSKTREYVSFLKGWAKGAGFMCKVKPNAWASAAVADKHTK